MGGYGMATLLEQLAARVVIGDGDVAAYLYAKGSPLGRSFECIVTGKQKADRKSTRLNSSHLKLSRMPSSA